MGVSENVVYPIFPLVLLIIIPIKWLFHWEYTQHFQTNPYGIDMDTDKGVVKFLGLPCERFQGGIRSKPLLASWFLFDVLVFDSRLHLEPSSWVFCFLKKQSCWRVEGCKKSSCLLFFQPSIFENTQQSNGRNGPRPSTRTRSFKTFRMVWRMLALWGQTSSIGMWQPIKRVGTTSVWLVKWARMDSRLHTPLHSRLSGPLGDSNMCQIRFAS